MKHGSHEGIHAQKNRGIVQSLSGILADKISNGISATTIVTALGVLASSALVYTASTAAFTGTTTNAGDQWNAGTVSLSDDDATVAMFSLAKDDYLKPGSTGSHCIEVTYGGNVESSVKLYSDNPATTQSMDQYIDLQIEQGNGGDYSSCTGFTPDATGTIFNNTLENFGDNYTAWGSGVTTWLPDSSGDSLVYRFTYTLNASAPNTVQTGTANIDFIWEAQST